MFPLIVENGLDVDFLVVLSNKFPFYNDVLYVFGHHLETFSQFYFSISPFSVGRFTESDFQF